MVELRTAQAFSTDAGSELSISVFKFLTPSRPVLLSQGDLLLGSVLVCHFSHEMTVPPHWFCLFFVFVSRNCTKNNWLGLILV